MLLLGPFVIFRLLSTIPLLLGLGGESASLLLSLIPIRGLIIHRLAFAALAEVVLAAVVTAEEVSQTGTDVLTAADPRSLGGKPPAQSTLLANGLFHLRRHARDAIVGLPLFPGGLLLGVITLDRVGRLVVGRGHILERGGRLADEVEADPQSDREQVGSLNAVREQVL